MNKRAREGDKSGNRERKRERIPSDDSSSLGVVSSLGLLVVRVVVVVDLASLLGEGLTGAPFGGLELRRKRKESVKVDDDDDEETCD